MYGVRKIKTYLEQSKRDTQVVLYFTSAAQHVVLCCALANKKFNSLQQIVYANPKPQGTLSVYLQEYTLNAI